MEPLGKITDALIRFVSDHPRLFVLTGAGCSTESGIPDYRDRAGAWKHTKPIQFREFVSSHQARQRYWARSMLGWPRFGTALPNRAHYALAFLESAGMVVQLVTQNVDGLHQEAGSRRVIDLHGRLASVECMGCGRRVPRAMLQSALELRNGTFRRIAAATAPDGDAHVDDVDIGGFDVPACEHCGGVLKPSVVFFGEAVPSARVDLAIRRLERADALLVVGSSLMVFSGYRFCRAASAENKPIAAINVGRTRADDELVLKVSAPCGPVLSDLTTRLGLSRLPR